MNKSKPETIASQGFLPVKQTAQSTRDPGVGTRLWRGVTLQLFLVTVLPLTLLVLAVTFGSLKLHHDAMRSLVADRNLRAVESAAANLSQEVSHRGKTLELLSREIDANQPVEDALARAEMDLAIFEGGVAAIDPLGNPTTFLGSSDVQQLARSAEWGELRNAVLTAQPGAAVYYPVISIYGQFYVPVFVTRTDGTSLLGLFSPKTLLSDGLTTFSQQGVVTVLVLTPDYQVLYQNGQMGQDENLTTHPGIQSALAGKSEIDYLPTAEGEHVITTSAIQPVGWGLMIEESWEDIASPLLRITQYAPMIIIPILGFALLALWFGLRQIVEPMQALGGKAGDLAQGNFDSIHQPVGGVPEIRRLQGTLIDMAEQLKEAQSSLHSYIGAITDSVENERRNLARDLHDETLQSLIALGQYAQYALHWNQDPQVEKTLNQMMDLTEQGTKNLRQLVRGLRPIYIEDLGLATALSMQATDQAIRMGFRSISDKKARNVA